MKTLALIVARILGILGFIAVATILTVWGGLMGCVIRTGDGDVCVEIVRRLFT